MVRKTTYSKKYTPMKLKPNYIIEFEEEIGCFLKRTRITRLIILPITQKDIDRGTNAEKPGLYGFRGLWYKGNGTKRTSYGKIYDLECVGNDYKIIRTNIKGLSKKQLQEILK